ncbi:UDP-N-acetylglucosamine 2-epimerase (non-hydrolyzing) [bacterium]|nr:MAG: UDP-N-acetylglucosamine 2-epimerase (non-hydrolyzing) [bacterium]RIK62363.1 MAG: UDP-N-acetylglucosamine 2-epimerase (non-hydrolyzing) [Planctomycetota bacterium]
MKADIAIVLGTRPEAIKLAPVALALAARQIPFHMISTGQHRDLIAGALLPFGLKPTHDLALMREGQSLDELLARLIAGLGQALAAIGPRMVVVQGDTATALAGALAAFHARIPCAHVEAGLRSGRLDAPWPEEGYRRMVDRIAARLYAPTPGARENLLAEGVEASRILVTGQTGVDAALWVAQRPRGAASGLPRLGERTRVIYATAHRREGQAALASTLAALSRVVAERPDVEVVMPLHPNPEVRRQALPFLHAHPRLHVIEPLGYADSVHLLRRASLVVTDSGGLQEEAPSFGLPVLVTREVTERPEGIEAGFLKIVGLDSSRLHAAMISVLDDPGLRDLLQRTPNPYGDGHAAERIADDLAGGALSG